jgi:Outer membrane protein beta-barrel domain
MKFLIVLITAVLISCVASAQHGNSPKGHVNLGIKGGINLYNVYNDDNTNYEQITGYYFGLLGHIHLSSQWAVQPELVYSRQGAKNGGTNYNLDYINVPVLLQYMFDNGFRLQAGPQLGLLVSAKSEINNESTDVKDNFKPFELAFGLGASYVHPPTGFGVDARYNFGLNNINDSGTVNSYNRGLQVGVFYLFRHGS